MRPPSPDGSGASFSTMTLNESASFLIEKMMNSTPEPKRYDILTSCEESWFWLGKNYCSIIIYVMEQSPEKLNIFYKN